MPWLRPALGGRLACLLRAVAGARVGAGAHVTPRSRAGGRLPGGSTPGGGRLTDRGLVRDEAEGALLLLRVVQRAPRLHALRLHAPLLRHCVTGRRRRPEGHLIPCPGALARCDAASSGR
jgi:hypothetical protein